MLFDEPAANEGWDLNGGKWLPVSTESPVALVWIL